MKKNLLFVIVIICGIITTAHAQIPNPGFESWTSGDPNGWVTSNQPVISMINVTQTTDMHHGNYALKGEVINFNTVPMGPVIQSGPGGTGFAISQQYHSLELYYKFTSVGGDKFSVNIDFEKGGNTIAQGAVALPATVSSYTKLSVPVTYTTGDIPDLAIIQILISGPLTGSDYHVGSVMFVDDLLFSLSTGTESIPVSNLTGKSFPNPAADRINIPFNENLTGEISLRVFDIYGKEIKKISPLSNHNGTSVIQLSVEDLLPGIYFYSIIGQDSRYQGKFTVSR